VAWNGLLLYYCVRFYDLNFELGRLLHLTVAGLGLYLPSLFLMDTGSPIAEIGLKLALLAAFPLLLWVTGFFGSEERSHLRAISLRAFARLRPRYKG
jgi:hypothetical protein